MTVKPSSGDAEHYDNEGHGFPYQDDIIIQAPQSCMIFPADNVGDLNITVVAAVSSSIS